jgi:hypothetical protein
MFLVGGVANSKSDLMPEFLQIFLVGGVANTQSDMMPYVCRFSLMVVLRIPNQT